MKKFSLSGFDVAVDTLLVFIASLLFHFFKVFVMKNAGSDPVAMIILGIVAILVIILELIWVCLLVVFMVSRFRFLFFKRVN